MDQPEAEVVRLFETRSCGIHRDFPDFFARYSSVVSSVA